MPEELWGAAVEAAREFGPWPVSQALRVNYESLKSRLQAGASTSWSVPPAAADSAFVECRVQDLFGAAADSGTVLELTSSAGAKLVVRLSPHDRLDVAALACSLWGAG